MLQAYKLNVNSIIDDDEKKRQEEEYRLQMEKEREEEEKKKEPLYEEKDPMEVLDEIFDRVIELINRTN